MPVGLLVNQLNNNSLGVSAFSRIDCSVEVQPGRRTAEIEGVEVESDTYAPGDTMKAIVFLTPYKGARQRVHVELPLPADLPEGSYSAQVSDELNIASQELRDNPTLSFPQTLDQLFESLRVQIRPKRTQLACAWRLKTSASSSTARRASPTCPAAWCKSSATASAPAHKR